MFFQLKNIKTLENTFITSTSSSLALKTNLNHLADGTIVRVWD